MLDDYNIVDAVDIVETHLREGGKWIFLFDVIHNQGKGYLYCDNPSSTKQQSNHISRGVQQAKETRARESPTVHHVPIQQQEQVSQHPFANQLPSCPSTYPTCSKSPFPYSCPFDPATQPYTVWPSKCVRLRVQSPNHASLKLNTSRQNKSLPLRRKKVPSVRSCFSSPVPNTGSFSMTCTMRSPAM
jgi:hypothetical protein